MTAEFLLDSNIIIYLIQGQSSALREHVERRQPGQIVTSSIVQAEVLIGLREEHEAVRRQANALFRLFPVHPFDETAARRFASLPFRRSRFDRLIAAHALSLGVALVTNNPGDFRDVAGLQLVDWMSAV